MHVCVRACVCVCVHVYVHVHVHVCACMCMCMRVFANKGASLNYIPTSCTHVKFLISLIYPLIYIIIYHLNISVSSVGSKLYPTMEIL